jgi:hypothetical protein
VSESVTGLPDPGVDHCQGREQGSAVDRVVGERSQLHGASSFPNSFLFVAESGIEQAERSQRRWIVRSLR